MEMVNVELDPFLDLLNQGDFDELTMKHIILNLANCLELLVKYKLEQEHWTLIFSDLNKIAKDNRERFKTSQCRKRMLLYQEHRTGRPRIRR